VHELAITEQLLQLTLRYAAQAGASRVVTLNLIIGEFSSVMDESVQFYWDMLAQDTIAAGAFLHFERIPGRLQCADCHAKFSMSEFDGGCPSCGGLQASTISGDEFRLDSIEVESSQNGSDQTNQG
jgi:hydrogenase nickel incorporation protein HypA/HybF